jgi:hypothetical protein
MKIILFLCIFMISRGVKAQLAVDSLDKYGKIMLEGLSEAERLEAGKVFGGLVDQGLLLPESFQFPANSLKSLSILESPDQRFRVITWSIPLENGRFVFHGRIQIRAPYQVWTLRDVSHELSKPEMKTLRNGDWYGAVYYQIAGSYSRKNPTYLLLGWNGNDAFSNKKLIETLQIDRKGSITFGISALNNGKRNLSRMIFEYAEKASMSLKYLSNSRMIVFDHLSPPQPSMEGMYAFYGPDFTYDAYKFRKGKWVFEKNIDVRNEGENKGRLPKAPEKGLPAPRKKKAP